MAGHTMLIGVLVKNSSLGVKTMTASEVMPKSSEISISKYRGLIIDSGPAREVRLALPQDHCLTWLLWNRTAARSTGDR